MKTMSGRGIAPLLLAASALLVIAPQAQADERHTEPQNRFVAKLRSTQEVPAASSVASGSISLVVDDAAQIINYELRFTDLEGPVAQAHIHTAQTAVNGGIMVWLCGTTALPGPAGTPVCPTTGTVTGVLTSLQVVGPAAQGIAPGEFAEVVAAIRNGLAYANVHSTKFPGGEIRGQLRRAQLDRKED